MTVEIREPGRSPGVALDDQAREAARLALVALLAEAPVHRIAMREAAKRAGVGLATLYKYFGGKEAMVTAVLGPDLETLVERLSEASRNAVGVKARLRAVLEASFAFARDYEDAARAVLLNLPAGVWAGDDSQWPARRRAVLAHILKNGRHDGSVRADLPVESLADLALGAVDQAVQRHLRSGEPIDPARLGAEAFTLVWPSLSAD
jgi:AcrR family transcriptional regulator